MKQDERYLNYLFTLGFILLIVIFIVSIVLISRVVLSEKTTIGEHVKNTQLLLEDISQVEKNYNNTFTQSPNRFLKLELSDLNVTDISYYTINENKSILTLILDSPIDKINNIYFIKIKDFNKVKNNEILVYNFNENIKFARFIGLENNLYIFSDLNNEKIEKVDKSQILGRLIYSKNGEN